MSKTRNARFDSFTLATVLVPAAVLIVSMTSRASAHSGEAHAMAWWLAAACACTAAGLLRLPPLNRILIVLAGLALWSLGQLLPLPRAPLPQDLLAYMTGVVIATLGQMLSSRLVLSNIAAAILAGIVTTVASGVLLALLGQTDVLPVALMLGGLATASDVLLRHAVTRVRQRLLDSVLIMLAGTATLVVTAEFAHQLPAWAALLFWPGAAIPAMLVLRPALAADILAIAALGGAPFMALLVPDPPLWVALIPLACAALMIPLQRARFSSNIPGWTEPLQAALLKAQGLTPVRLDLVSHELAMSAQARSLFRLPDMPRMGQWLDKAPAGELLGLMELLRKGSPGSADHAMLHLPDAAGQARIFTVVLLQREGSQCWIILRDVTRESDTVVRNEQLEEQIGQMLLREERLLALASHELRTPLAALAMIHEDLDEGSTWDEFSTLAHGQVDRMLSILDALRAAAGGGVQSRVSGRYTPREIADALVLSHEASARGAGMELSIDLPDADISLEGDPARIELTLSRLITNAIRHSGGSTIHLSLVRGVDARGRPELVWQVRDDGQGIDPKLGEMIFSPFRGQDASGSTSEGSGLGLYTARRAAELMGGSLVMRETREGASFVLAHPAREATRNGRHDGQGPDAT